MTLITIVYDDGHTEDVDMRQATFGVDGVFAHGPVREAFISPRNVRPDRSPDHAYPNHNRVSRSIMREVPDARVL